MIHSPIGSDPRPRMLAMMAATTQPPTAMIGKT